MHIQNLFNRAYTINKKTFDEYKSIESQKDYQKIDHIINSLKIKDLYDIIKISIKIKDKSVTILIEYKNNKSDRRIDLNFSKIDDHTFDKLNHADIKDMDDTSTYRFIKIFDSKDIDIFENNFDFLKSFNKFDKLDNDIKKTVTSNFLFFFKKEHLEVLLTISKRFDNVEIYNALQQYNEIDVKTPDYFCLEKVANILDFIYNKKETLYTEKFLDEIKEDLKKVIDQRNTKEMNKFNSFADFLKLIKNIEKFKKENKYTFNIDFKKINLDLDKAVKDVVDNKELQDVNTIETLREFFDVKKALNYHKRCIMFLKKVTDKNLSFAKHLAMIDSYWIEKFKDNKNYKTIYLEVIKYINSLNITASDEDEKTILRTSLILVFSYSFKNFYQSEYPKSEPDIIEKNLKGYNLKLYKVIFTNENTLRNVDMNLYGKYVTFFENNELNKNNSHFNNFVKKIITPTSRPTTGRPTTGKSLTRK